MDKNSKIRNVWYLNVVIWMQNFKSALVYISALLENCTKYYLVSDSQMCRFGVFDEVSKLMVPKRREDSWHGTVIGKNAKWLCLFGYGVRNLLQGRNNKLGYNSDCKPQNTVFPWVFARDLSRKQKTQHIRICHVHVKEKKISYISFAITLFYTKQINIVLEIIFI